MDHLLHPWHYVPILAALPFVGVFVTYVKQQLTGEGNASRRNEEAESDSRVG